MRGNMKSNSRTPALEMNEKEKKWPIRRSDLSFRFVLEILKSVKRLHCCW